MNTENIKNSYSYQDIQASASFIKERIEAAGHKIPEVALILGSGLGVIGDEVKNPLKIPYNEIPLFPISTAPGHAGQLVFGELEGREVVVFQGRFHSYEGYSHTQIAFPVRVMKVLGIEMVLLTNACGGVNESFTPGTLMLIEDHIKFCDDTPLRGANIDELGPRFPDVSTVYTPRLQDVARKAAQEEGIDLKQGVYMMFPGPQYETPAEVRMARILGASAVGMSTVPEAIAAAHAGQEVLGISCITNLAAGMSGNALNHEEVLEIANKVRAEFVRLIKRIITLM